MSARSASNASTSIPFRLTAAIRRLPFVVRLDRTIQSKGKASTPKWHATYIKRISLSFWYPGTVGILRLEGRGAVRQGHRPCGIDHIPPSLLMQPRPNGILLVIRPRRGQTDDEPCSTHAANAHCGASAAFLQHRAAICADLGVNHRQPHRRPYTPKRCKTV